MIKKTLFLSIVIWLLEVTCSSAQNVIDTLLRYGAPLTFMSEDGVNAWIAHREREVGYRQCYAELYDMLGQASHQATERRDSLRFDLSMSHLLMGWQHGVTDSEKTQQKMLRLMDDCIACYGDTSTAYTTVAIIMGTFYCANGNFDLADSCYCRITGDKKSNLRHYTYQRNQAMYLKMISEFGRGRIYNAWTVAKEIYKLCLNKLDNSSYWNGWPGDDEWVASLILPDDARQRAAVLATQMTLPIIPPAPETILYSEIEPWPQCMPSSMNNSLGRGLLGVISLHEMIARLQLSKSNLAYLDTYMRNMCTRIFDYYYRENVPPLLASDIAFRTAQVSLMRAETGDSILYDNIDRLKDLLYFWRPCFVMEQLNGEARSAVPLLHFATQWIKHGYALRVLPFIQEAVTNMERELAVEHPTQRQMAQQRHDREWLKKYLPQLEHLSAHIPEYSTVLSALQALASNQFFQ